MISLFFACALSLSSFANGTFQLEGTVKSFSPDTIEVFDGHSTYTIKRSALPMAEQEKLKSVHTNTKVSLSLPFSSVVTVRK